MELKIKKLHPDARVPQFALPSDAGLDLCTTKDVAVAPGERALFPTGVAFAIPEGYVGLIWDKSGVSNKRGMKVLGGVVDACYRGEVFVGLVNLGSEPQTFEAGDKIAQILIQKVEQPTLVEVDELDETQRGEGAFGSTGK